MNTFFAKVHLLAFNYISSFILIYFNAQKSCNTLYFYLGVR